MKKRKILISVTNKDDLEKFKRLTDTGKWEILSTGGTAKRFAELGIPCTLIEDYTGFPEILDGRLKTIHPKVAGGMLTKRSSFKQMQEARNNGIEMIDVVVVNLYNFAGDPSVKQIDVGGPNMLRAAAKNAVTVTVVVDPKDYDIVIDELLANDTTSPELRERLALDTFLYTASYDTMIANWLIKEKQNGRKPFDETGTAGTGH